MENIENSDVMEFMPRFFWRRAFAFFIDLLVVAILFTVIAVGVNSVFKINLMAPGFVKSTYCKPADFISKERFEKIFPDEPNVVRSQYICKYTTMGITSINLGLLMRQTSVDGVGYNQKISLPIPSIDREILPMEYLLLDTIMYLLAPLLFALMISRYGKTIGKRWMGLTVADISGKKPSLMTAIRREYIKGILFVLISLSGLYELFQSSGLSYEDIALSLGPLTEMQLFNRFGVGIALAIGGFVVVFWFTFGSFIRWRDQTYWDRWSGLFVVGDRWTQPAAVSAKSQTKI